MKMQDEKQIWEPGTEERRLMDNLARKENLRVQNFQSRVFSEQVPLHLISKVCNLLPPPHLKTKHCFQIQDLDF